MSFLGAVRGFVFGKPKLAPPPPSYGYPEPILIGQLLGTLTAYVPRSRSDGNKPEHTPVKVQKISPDPAVYEVYDIAYIGFDRNTEQIILTLREPSS